MRAVPGGEPALRKRKQPDHAGHWMNTAAVTAPVSLAAGTYWLAYLPSDNNLAFRSRDWRSSQYYAYSSGAMPATFSTSPKHSGNHALVLVCDAHDQPDEIGTSSISSYAVSEKGNARLSGGLPFSL